MIIIQKNIPIEKQDNPQKEKEKNIPKEQLDNQDENLIQKRKEEIRRLIEIEKFKRLKFQKDKKSYPPCPPAAGPPGLKKNYECYHKFKVILENKDWTNPILMECSPNDKINDIIERIQQKININYKILLLFENQILDSNLLVSETNLHHFCKIRVIILQ